MKKEFKELFEYNNHFNQKLILLLSGNIQNMSDKNLKLINQLNNAQQIWNARITNEKEFDVWQINKWNDLLNIDNENYSTTLKIITDNNLNNISEYTNSKGVKFRSEERRVGKECRS